MIDTSKIFNEARRLWDEGAEFRARRGRFMRNTYGDQWNDPVLSKDGTWTTDYQKAVSLGMNPKTNNLLRSLVKTVVGRFRYDIDRERASSASSDELREFVARNQLDELDARAIEEYLISGCAAQKLIYESRTGKPCLWVDNVAPDRLIVNNYIDPRGSDIRLVGQLLDFSPEELKLRFGHASAKREKELGDLYAGASRCRVIEVWHFDIDYSSPSIDPHWHCRFFSPAGELIDETRSYLPDGAHPFFLRFYPGGPACTHPFIEDLVDRQKHINSLITTIDHILTCSAKGVLLFPTDCLPPGMEMEMASELWGNPGGVIPVNPYASRMPQEVHSQGQSEGAAKLLECEMKMFQSISGVTSALQGRAEGSNTSASLFESQVFNSAIALRDVYESFNSLRRCRNAMAERIIKDFSL